MNGLSQKHSRIPHNKNIPQKSSTMCEKLPQSISDASLRSHNIQFMQH